MSMMRVAVIGGGLSGSSAAFSLASSRKAIVTLFDQGRTPGGRASSRQYEDLSFDHGLQFIRSKESEPCSIIDELVKASVLCPWKPKVSSYGADDGGGFFKCLRPGGTLLVGSPSASEICRHLLKNEGIRVQPSTRIETVSLSDDGTWVVKGEEFDALVVSDILSASPQSPSYVKAEGDRAIEVMSSFHKAGLGFEGHVIFSLMLLMSERLPFDAATLNGRHIAFIVDESSKPGRSLRTDGNRPVTVITNERFGALLSGRDASGRLPPQSPSYLEERCRMILKGLEEDLDGFGIHSEKLNPSFAKCHRWGAAYPKSACADPGLVNVKGKFAVAGDFWGGGGAGGAIKSGQMAANSILGLSAPTVSPGR